MTSIKNYRKKMRIKKGISSVLLNIFFIMICFLALIPVFYSLLVSLSGNHSLVSDSIWPKEWTFENYIKLFTEHDIGTWFGNSLLLVVATVVFSLTIAVPAAYAFSRMRFHGRNFVLRQLIILNAFPSVLSMFAIYKLMRSMGLVNTKTGLIIIYVGTMSIFALWNMKGYFDTIPVAIEEAARVDGASQNQIIWKIIMPLAKPATAVTAVMILIYVWNEYIYAVTFMTGEDNFTLAAGLYSLQASETSGNWPVFAAASLVVSLPILIIFLLSQKYMVSGLSSGGVKK